MESVVLQLQNDALGKAVTVSELLRKAYVIARKLKLSDFLIWIENELNGYKDKVPDYRIVNGQVRYWNPYNGWLLLSFEDLKEGEIYSKKPNGQSIAVLEHLVLNKEKKNTLFMPFPANIKIELCKGLPGITEISLFIDQSELIKIIDSVRNIILNWTLKLEEEGILGESLTFSDEEKNNAEKTPQNIVNFYAPVQEPQILQGDNIAIQNASFFKDSKKEFTEFFVKLKKELINIKLSKDNEAELESEINTIKAQLESPKPKDGIINASMKTIKTILEGASGLAVGQLLDQR